MGMDIAQDKIQKTITLLVQQATELFIKFKDAHELSKRLESYRTMNSDAVFYERVKKNPAEYYAVSVQEGDENELLNAFAQCGITEKCYVNGSCFDDYHGRYLISDADYKRLEEYIHTTKIAVIENEEVEKAKTADEEENDLDDEDIFDDDVKAENETKTKTADDKVTDEKQVDKSEKNDDKDLFETEDTADHVESDKPHDDNAAPEKNINDNDENIFGVENVSDEKKYEQTLENASENYVPENKTFENEKSGDRYNKTDEEDIFDYEDQSDELENQPFTPNDVGRLDEEGEKCVEFIKIRIQEELDKIFEE